MAVKTVTGEVIDITCYVRHDSKGPKHTKCATVCADLGMPLGLLEDETNESSCSCPPATQRRRKPWMASSASMSRRS
jgi:hypothetical protein